MGKTQPVTKLVQGDANKVNAGRRKIDCPSFSFIEMAVACYRATVRWRVKAVSQNPTWTVKRTAIAVVARDKTNDHVWVVCERDFCECQRSYSAPHSQGLGNCAPNLSLREVRCKILETIG
jgi:hypothetical protein